MLYASVDPGVKHAGVALWDPSTKALVRAYLVQGVNWLDFLKGLPASVSGGVVEIPQVYPGKPVRHEDLIQLAVSAGAIAGFVRGEWKQARPAIWTRQTTSNKSIRIERAVAKLTPDEQKVVEWPSTQLRCADVGDAIALGLWALGRW